MESTMSSLESDVPGAPAAADGAPAVYETHTGLVVLVGDRVYKSKKPVATPFLDFSTVARRERACVRELEVNRRLAPQAYLGVAHLVGPGTGEREAVLVMRRYPDSARLSTRVKSGGPGTAGELTAVARVLAEFHARAHRGAEVDAEATVAAVSLRWNANLDEMRPFSGTAVSGNVLDRIADLAQRYLAGRGALFAGRIADRRIVDGHADLLADDIFCCESGPVLLDCLDFDDRLRYVDGIDDAAFLAMDLERLGRADLAERFLADYRRFAHDTAPCSLDDFYIAYRAGVRAKIDCIRVAQGHSEAAADAARHLQIAVDHLRAAVPVLVLVGGGPGTGKTTVSRSLAGKSGAQLISTDDVRKELRADGSIDGAAGVVDSGLYGAANVAAVYDEVLRRAQVALSGGRSVILDATWRDPVQRGRARDLAARTYSAITEIACVATLPTAQERIAHRTATASDATVEIAAALAERGGDGVWAGAHRVDTGKALSDTADEAARLFRGAIDAPGRRGDGSA